MHRVLIPPEALSARSIAIRDPRTLHHLLRVLRVKAGDRLECFTDRGERYVGVITRRTLRECLLDVEQAATERPSPLRVTLAASLIRPERFDWLIEKATELGVTRILPITTARTRARVQPDRVANRLARWRRIAEAAAAQCGRATVPALDSPEPFERAVKALARPRNFAQHNFSGMIFTLEETQATPIERCLQEAQAAGEAAVLIGPEGDFTPEEVRVAVAHDMRAVRLRCATLRSETAVLAALVLLQQAAGMF